MSFKLFFNFAQPKMKIRVLSLTTLLFCLCSCVAIKQEKPPQFNLSFGSFVPQSGDETEKTMDYSMKYCLTNFLTEPLVVTNFTVSKNEQFKDKILDWNSTNDTAKIEITTDYFNFKDTEPANKQPKPKTQLVGSYILGEWFFRPLNKNLFNKNINSFSRMYWLHPGAGLKYFDYLQLNQPRAIGENWKITLPLDLSRSLGINDLLKNYFVKRLAQQMTNNLESTAQFIGVTNVSGINCSHLRLTSKTQGTTEEMDFRMRDNTDFIVPLDPAIKFWMETESGNATFLVKRSEYDTNITLASGIVSLQITEKCQALPNKLNFP